MSAPKYATAAQRKHYNRGYVKPTGVEPELVHSQVMKQRRCLLCLNDFPSHHYGERVCVKCKETKNWLDIEQEGLMGRRKRQDQRG